MMRFLILYGDNNDIVTFDSDDHHHAIEQFVSWAPVSPDPEVNRLAINEICLAIPIEYTDEENSLLYAVGEDGSYFGARDLSIVTVPANITDGDEVEDFIVNHRDRS